MDQINIRVKTDGRLDVTKQIISQLGGRARRLSVAKKGKMIVVNAGGDRPTALDGRLRLRADEVVAIGLSPGDMANIKYQADRNQVSISAGESKMGAGRRSAGRATPMMRAKATRPASRTGMRSGMRTSGSKY